MGLSLKQAASSTVGKILTGAAIFAAGHIIDKSAEAAEITTITQAAAKLCIGADMGGFITGEVLGWKGTLTDGKSTGFTISEKTAFTDKMYNPSKPQIGIHRNYAYTQYPANNDIIEGYYLYNVADPNNVQESFVINSKNYPDYKESTRLHFVKGATPDQDQMIFLNDTIKVYKSPFDANGNVKPESKAGPIVPEFTYKINFDATDIRAIGNFIFTTTTGGNPVIHKLVVGANGITEDPKVVTLNGLKTGGWAPIHDGFVLLKDSNGIATTYLTVNGKKIILVNIEDINDYKETDATNDIAVEDPSGRYMFKAIKDVAGNYDTYITDAWAKPGTNKKIISNNLLPLRGNLVYSPDYPTPAWILYGKNSSDGSDGTNNKAYLIELLDPATMNVKVTEAPFDTFKNKFVGGGEACVTIPGQVATVVKTGGTPDAGGDTGANEGAVEKDQDAGTTEVDAGSTPDVAAEVVDAPDIMSSDADAAIDAWVDGGSDMQDIFAVDETSTPDVGPDVGPDQADAAVDGVVTPPDMSIEDASLDDSLPPDVQSDTQNDVSIAPDGKADAQETSEVDGTVIPPDMSTGDAEVDGSLPPDVQPKEDTKVDADATLPQPDNGTDTPFDAGTKPGIDGGSSDTSGQPVVSAPAPKDTGCNAGGNGNNLSPLAIAAATALAIGLARKREEES